MKPASPALLALLKTGRFYLADLYMITLVSGAVLRYAAADIDIKYGGNTFSSKGPRFERSRATWHVGLDVDQATINIYPRPTDLVSGVPFLQAVLAGIFDGGECQVDRAYMPNAGDTSPGVVTMVAGRIGDIQAGRSNVVMPVNSHLELLNRQFPGNLYASSCGNTLFDPRCGLLKSSFSENVTAKAGATTSVIPVTSAKAAGYYTLGTVQFASGANAGVLTSIKRWDGVNLTLDIPLAVAPATGDAMTLTPGCDHTQATCEATFNNLAKYRGYDFTPVPETAL